MDKPDFSATQKFIIRHPGLASILRKSLTPAALWGAIGVLGTILSVLIGAVVYVGNAQNRLTQHQESIEELKRSIATLTDIAQDTKTSVATITTTMHDMKDEQDRQRQWREDIEREAERPPHPRHR